MVATYDILLHAFSGSQKRTNNAILLPSYNAPVVTDHPGIGSLITALAGERPALMAELDAMSWVALQDPGTASYYESHHFGFMPCEHIGASPFAWSSALLNFPYARSMQTRSM